MLSERKKKILQAVVSEQIEKPQTVSSKDLKEKYFDDLSSATIRNELMALEEMGYLFQPHTSSGRLPTAEGFKKYINELMPEKELTLKEVQKLKSGFDSKINSMEDLAGTVARAISGLTDYASVVYVNGLAPATIESVKLVRISDDDALIIVITDLGVIKDLVVTVDEELSDEDLVSAGKFITQVMAGRVITELDAEELKIEFSLLGDKYTKLFMVVLEAIYKRENKPIIQVEGTSNLLHHPEYNNPEKAQKALKLFEKKDVLVPLLEAGNNLEVSIKVGEDESEDCSVVSASYKINGKNVGTAGIIGPVRMDYAKAVSVLKEVNSVIAEELNFKNNKKLKGEQNERSQRDKRKKD